MILFCNGNRGILFIGRKLGEVIGLEWRKFQAMMYRCITGKRYVKSSISVSLAMYRNNETTGYLHLNDKVSLTLPLKTSVEGQF
jgi:hypothetical protein